MANSNDFKIDDLKEYEFVQRQRAYLYDPNYLKGSSQFKTFSSMVGFGSFMTKASDDPLDISGTKKLRVHRHFDRGIEDTLKNFNNQSSDLIN